jgi:general secretion pathway protein G
MIGPRASSFVPRTVPRGSFLASLPLVGMLRLVRGPRNEARPEARAPRPEARHAWQQGYTFIELLVVATILLILASAAMPLTRVTIQRTKEAELRRVLREMRTAIDKFKDAVDAGLISNLDLRAGSEGYPPNLETLVEGVTVANDASGRKLKFLRRIPIDPLTGEAEWGMRAYQDRPDARSWGGQNVFDVYSLAEGTGLDGTKYRDW